MLEVCSGPSHLDNDPEDLGIRGERTDRGSNIYLSSHSGAGELWVAQNDSETYVACRGRVTWTNADAFRGLARGAIEAGRPLNVDFSQCNCLDSTFLGTLHEVVSLDSNDLVGLYKPNDVIQGLFVELGLKEVMAAVHEGNIVPPAEQTVIPAETPTLESHRLLLQAHEALSELSEENRGKFSGVIEALKAELGEEV